MNGSLKRQADHASLYMGARNTITSAQGFHEWNENRTTARGEKSKVKTFVINQQDIDTTSADEKLKKRWDKARTVTGTQGYRSFAPDPNDKDFLHARTFYSSVDSVRLRHSKK